MSALMTALICSAAIALLVRSETANAPSGSAELADRIDDLLPQTQCGKCGYAACRPYAEAIALGAADINQCPPGGQNTIRRLARLLGRDSKPLNPAFGKAGPRTVAMIEEETCIGCFQCICACPVDAIIGARQQMHTVMPALCTGCELCIPPCPVDCISMLLVTRAGHRLKFKPAVTRPGP